MSNTKNNKQLRPKSNIAQIILATCAVLTLLITLMLNWGNSKKDDKNALITENTLSFGEDSLLTNKTLNTLDSIKQIRNKSNSNIYTQFDTINNVNIIVDSAVNQLLTDKNHYSLAYKYLIDKKKFDFAKSVLNRVSKRTIQKSIIEQVKYKRKVLDYLINTGYDDFWYNPKEDINPFIKNDKYGFYNRKNNVEVIKPIYSDLDFLFKQKMFKVKKNNRWGLIKYDGTLLFECIFSDISDGEHFIIVKENGKTGLLNNVGKIIKEPIYQDIERVWEHLYTIKDEEYYGMFNKYSKDVLEMKYDSIWVDYESDDYDLTIGAILEGETLLLNDKGEIK